MKLTESIKVPLYSLKLVKEKSIKYRPDRLNGPEAVEKLLGFMGDLSEEHFYCVYLDTKFNPTGLSLISKGTLNSSLVHPREVFKGALLANAYAIIVAHNHPSGTSEPSPEDIEVTETLIKAGRMLGVRVLDHVIMADQSYSFREHKEYLWG